MMAAEWGTVGTRRLPGLCRDAIKRLGEDTIRARYGNLFHMYQKITAENPYQRADADLPRGALHHGRAVGGLRSRCPPIPGLFVLRRSQLLSDHGANRLGASSALMQGLADGYFVLPATRSPTGTSRARPSPPAPMITKERAAFAEAENEVRAHQDPAAALSIQRQADRGQRSTASWARSCGITAAWPAAREGPRRSAVTKIQKLRE